MGAAALLTAAGLLVGGGHPWHRSRAEIDLRADPPRIEVALRVDAFDFEQHLGELAGRSVSLDRPEEIRALVAGYLARRFLVRTGGGHWAEFRYLGLEADLVDCWLYFEAPLPPGPGPLAFSNQVLLERNAFQENQLQVRGEDFGALLACTAEHPWQTLVGVRLPPPPRPPVGWSVRLPPTPGTEPAEPTPRSVADLGPVGR